MTALELARLVKDCRRAQKAYFRDRSMPGLEEAKRLERELDRAVEAILADRPAPLPGLEVGR